MFTLLSLETAELVSKAQFADGKKAARAAALLSRKTGRKYQVRKAPESSVDWQARELERFATGEYVGLYYELAMVAPREHFAHVAKKAPTLIAYTKDAIKGAADKQSLLSVAAYVDLVAPNASQADKERIIARQLAHAKEKRNPLRFATTADEIEAVYTNYDSSCEAVAASCMRYSASNFEGRMNCKPVHPVRAYAGGDLAIAYLANDAGETIARALVWPAKKLYSRAYANTGTLVELLRAEGYDGAGYYSGRRSMRGAKLARLESDCGGLIVPYLDEIGDVSDHGDYLTIGGDLDAQSTSGVIDVTPQFMCERCENLRGEEDTTTVYTRSNRSRSEQWCDCCLENDAFFCEGTNEYYAHHVNHSEVGSAYYCDAYLQENAYWCEHYDEWTFDEVCDVYINENGRAESWSESALDNDAYEFEGEWFSNDIESIDVVIARAVPRVISWRALVWLHDVTEKMPLHIFEEREESGHATAYLATDGRCYSTDCVDHYPVDRPKPTPVQCELPLAAE